MFKEKSSKKRLALAENLKESGTLDSQHQLMVSHLQQGLIERDDLKKREQATLNDLVNIKARIENLHKEGLIDTPEYEEAWNHKLKLITRLKEIRFKLQRTFDEKKELEYYENTANILFNYYNLLENQEAMVSISPSPDINKQPSSMNKNRKKVVSQNQKSILEAFQMKPSTVCREEFEDMPLQAKKITTDKTSLVEEYMLIMDTNYIKNVNMPSIGNCQKCDIQLMCILQEGIMICPTCGYQELLLVEQNRPVYYRQTNKETCNQSYKRINHFNEWVSQIQGKESTEIAEEIFEKIVQEIKKEQITDTHKLSYNKMREILKKLKFNKYYEHIYYIIYRLNGVAPPNFSPELEERLRSMFKEIQGPFLKHCPCKRKNFLSYSYVLFKFCQLLEKDEHLKHFSLLKSREKLHVQDQIWRKICEEVNWEFIQSI